MKKSLCIIVLCAVCFTSCITEPVSTTTYYYVNNTSTDIEICSVQSGEVDTHSYKKQFIILSGEKYELYFENEGNNFFREPLRWTGMDCNLDYSTVSNGIVIKRESRLENTDLYDLNKYQLISQKKNRREYEYTFTDDYFVDGELIE